MTLSDLVASIDAERRHGNLSSAIRLFVLDHYQAGNGQAADVPPPRGRILATAASALRPE